MPNKSAASALPAIENQSSYPYRQVPCTNWGDSIKNYFRSVENLLRTNKILVRMRYPKSGKASQPFALSSNQSETPISDATSIQINPRSDSYTPITASHKPGVALSSRSSLKSPCHKLSRYESAAPHTAYRSRLSQSAKSKKPCEPPDLFELSPNNKQQYCKILSVLFKYGTVKEKYYHNLTILSPFKSLALSEELIYETFSVLYGPLSHFYVEHLQKESVISVGFRDSMAVQTLLSKFFPHKTIDKQFFASCPKCAFTATLENGAFFLQHLQTCFFEHLQSRKSSHFSGHTFCLECSSYIKSSVYHGHVAFFHNRLFTFINDLYPRSAAKINSTLLNYVKNKGCGKKFLRNYFPLERPLTHKFEILQQADNMIICAFQLRPLEISYSTPPKKLLEEFSLNTFTKICFNPSLELQPSRLEFSIIGKNRDISNATRFLAQYFDSMPSRTLLESPSATYSINFLNVNLSNQTNQTSPSRIIVPYPLNKRTLHLVYDTGADVSCLTVNDFATLLKQPKVRFRHLSEPEMTGPYSKNARIADCQGNTIHRLCDPIELELEFSGLKILQKFLILRNLSSSLLGMDFIRRNEVKTDCGRDDITLRLPHPKHYLNRHRPTVSIKAYYVDNLKLGLPFKSFLNSGVNFIKVDVPFCHQTLVEISPTTEQTSAVHIKPGILSVDEFCQVKIPFCANYDVELSPDLPLFSLKPAKDIFALNYLGLSSTSSDSKLISEHLNPPSKNFKKIRNPGFERNATLQAYFASQPYLLNNEQLTFTLAHENIIPIQNDMLNQNEPINDQILKSTPHLSFSEFLQARKQNREQFTVTVEPSTHYLINNIVSGKINPEELSKTRSEEASSSIELELNKNNLNSSYATNSIPNTIPYQMNFSPDNKNRILMEKDITPVDPDEIVDDELEPLGLNFDENKKKIDWRAQLGEMLSGKTYEELLNFLNSKPGLIAESDLDCGKIKDFHISDLGFKPNAVVRCPVYKLDPIRTTLLHTYLSRLERAGLITKGVSRYFSPVFLIDKKSGGVRVIFDYRIANSNTDEKFYRIPEIPQLVQTLGATKPTLFSIIDLKAAYNSIELKGLAREQSAIRTQNSTYLVNRLFFGSSIAPSIFSQQIERCIDKCPDLGTPYVLSYFDDILVFSKDGFDDHLQKIKAVFTQLHESGFKIGLDKCQFFKNQVPWLGQIISAQGISPQPRHIREAKNILPPTSKKGVQSILGILNYLRPYVHRFAEQMFHITSLLRSPGDDRTPIDWGDKEQKALDHMKSLLTENMLIAHVDYDAPIYFSTDSSQVACSSFCYQVKIIPRKAKEVAEAFNFNALEFEKKVVLPKPGKRVSRAFQLNNPDKEIVQEMEKLDVKLTPNKAETNKEFMHFIQPLGFHSKIFSSTHMSYTPLEKEAMGLVVGSIYWDSLLKGFKEKYLLHDSSSLLYLLKGGNDKLTKLSRWLIRINQLDTNLIGTHVKSEDCVCPDFYSRNYHFAVIKESKNKMSPKKPVFFRAAIPPGQIITFEQLVQAFNSDPSIVYQIEGTPTLKTLKIPKKLNANISLLTSSKEFKVNYVGTQMINELTKELDPTNILKVQLEDENCKAIKDSIAGDNDTPYFIFPPVNGLLYRLRDGKEVKTPQNGRIVLPKSLVFTAIVNFHLESHSGRDALMKLMNQFYYYPNMAKEVTKFTSACYLCSIYRPTKTRTRTSDRPWLALPESKAFGVLNMDIIEGLPHVNGYKYILSLCDAYSKFRILLPLRNRNSQAIANMIERHVFSLALPDVICSDLGKELVISKAMQNKCDLYGVRIHTGAPYSSFSRGLIEGSNRIAKECLSQLCHKNPRKWPELLSLTMLCINNKPSTTMEGLSSSEALLGYYSDPSRKFSEKIKNYKGYADLKKSWSRHRTKVDAIVRRWHLKRNILNAKYHRGKERPFEKGTLVYARDNRPKSRAKLRPTYYPVPLVIVQDKDMICLIQAFNGQVYKIHKQHLRKCSIPLQESYGRLPAKVKWNLGLEHTEEELKTLIEGGTIPDFYTARSRDFLDLRPGEAYENTESLLARQPEIYLDSDAEREQRDREARELLEQNLENANMSNDPNFEPNENEIDGDYDDFDENYFTEPEFDVYPDIEQTEPTSVSSQIPDLDFPVTTRVITNDETEEQNSDLDELNFPTFETFDPPQTHNYPLRRSSRLTPDTSLTPTNSSGRPRLRVQIPETIPEVNELENVATPITNSLDLSLNTSSETPQTTEPSTTSANTRYQLRTSSERTHSVRLKEI